MAAPCRQLASLYRQLHKHTTDNVLFYQSFKRTNHNHFNAIDRGRSVTYFNRKIYTENASDYGKTGNDMPRNAVSVTVKRCYYNTTSRNSTTSSSENKSRLSFVVAGLGLGLSAVYALKRIVGNDTIHAGTPMPSNLKISRQIRHPTDNTGLKLTLFQYQTCPFCCKVRAYLDYHGFSYDVVEVNSVLRSQIKWSDYKKVPILVHEEEENGNIVQLNDSSVIISALETFLVDPTQSLDKILVYYPGLESNEKKKKTIEFPNKYFIMYGDAKLSSTEEERRSERKWRKWVESVLVHTLSPNIYRTPSESLQAFKYFSEVGNWKENFSAPMTAFIIYVGASAMYFVGKILKKRHNLNDDVRLSLYQAANEWDKAVGKKKRFLGGDQPNLADLSVYGVLSSIEGCEAFQDLLANTNVKKWYYTMKEEISQSSGGPPLSRRK